MMIGRLGERKVEMEEAGRNKLNKGRNMGGGNKIK